MDRPVVHCIQHSERVRPQTVAEWAQERDVDFRVVRVDLGEVLPPVEEVDRLVVLGGGMNTDQSDEHSWIDLERDWLRAILNHGEARVFGICLGSQLLAEALGGTVERAGVPERGWHRIELTHAGLEDPVFGTLPPAFDAMQWHGDAWTLPPGARLLATSDGCPTQAFAWGDHVYAVQFHPEFTFERTVQLVATTTDDLTPHGAVQAPEQFLADEAPFTALRMLCVQLLDRALLAPIEAPVSS